MDDFSLLLSVVEWAYGKESRYDDESGEFVTRRRVILRCMWDAGPGPLFEFYIDGRPFTGPIPVTFREGQPVAVSPPRRPELLRSVREVQSVIRDARYFPRTENAEQPISEFLAVDLLVDVDTFDEIFALRREIRRLTLRVVGDKVALGPDGEPSWQLDGKIGRLYVIGYDYSASSAVDLPPSD
jgi:hypothetical protein